MTEMALKMNAFEPLTMDEMMTVDGGGTKYEIAAAVVTYTGLFIASGPVGVAVACAGAGMYLYDAYKRHK